MSSQGNDGQRNNGRMEDVDKKRQGSDRIGLMRLNSDKFAYLGEFFYVVRRREVLAHGQWTKREFNRRWMRMNTDAEQKGNFNHRDTEAQREDKTRMVKASQGRSRWFGFDCAS